MVSQPAIIITNNIHTCTHIINKFIERHIFQFLFSRIFLFVAASHACLLLLFFFTITIIRFNDDTQWMILRFFFFFFGCYHINITTSCLVVVSILLYWPKNKNRKYKTSPIPRIIHDIQFLIFFILFFVLFCFLPCETLYIFNIMMMSGKFFLHIFFVIIIIIMELLDILGFNVCFLFCGKNIFFFFWFWYFFFGHFRVFFGHPKMKKNE